MASCSGRATRRSRGDGLSTFSAFKLENANMTESPKFDEIALNHAWRWFEYHAAQRLSMIRFYLLIIGGAATAYFAALREFPAASVAAAFFGCVCSILFWRLDKRASYLVKLGERAITEQETLLAAHAQLRQIGITLSTENKEGVLTSYGQLLRAMFFLAFFVYLGAAVVAFSRICSAT